MPNDAYRWRVSEPDTRVQKGPFEIPLPYLCRLHLSLMSEDQNNNQSPFKSFVSNIRIMTEEVVDKCRYERGWEGVNGFNMSSAQ